MAPGARLARLRKHVLDQVARGVLTMAAAAARLGISRSSLEAPRHRYGSHREVGLFPKRTPGQSHPVLRDAIALKWWAVDRGARTTAAWLALLGSSLRKGCTR